MTPCKNILAMSVSLFFAAALSAQTETTGAPWSQPEESLISATAAPSAAPFAEPWLAALPPLDVFAEIEPTVGEPINGFPNWAERVIHEWMNRARSSPQYEMSQCGAPCGEAACYSVMPPLLWSNNLSRAARFHSDEMTLQGYFAHDSACTVVPNINSLYPGSCNGAASCACVGGTRVCNPTCTSWSSRVSMFGTSPSGEIIASPSDPNSSFYLWLYENSPSTTCSFSQLNGHRWLILKAVGSVGIGVTGDSVADFGSGGAIPKIPSGSHYPRQSSSVQFWTNWYDTAAPTEATVNVDGTCYPMTLERGSGTNGAWRAILTNVGSGCHRYFFSFKDSSGVVVTYPTTGSFGVGPAGSCSDWDATRPSSCDGPFATSTTLTSSLNASTFGQQVTFTVTVASTGGTPTGTVTFFDGASSLGSAALNGSGQASLSTSALNAGSHSITASFAGSANFNASVSSSLTQTVNPAVTSTGVTTALDPTVYGQVAAFTATVTSAAGVPTGTVTFLDGATVIGSGTLNGAGQTTVGTPTLSGGTHSITAAFAGSLNYGASTSAPLSQTVNPVGTAMTLNSDPSPSTFGQQVTLTANVGSFTGPTPVGSVLFRDGPTTIGTVPLIAGSASMSISSLSAGDHSLNAEYLGNASFSGSSAPVRAHTVNVASTTTSVAAFPSSACTGSPATFVATVSSATGAIPIGTVTFRDGVTSLGTFELNNAGQAARTGAALSLGAHSITAEYNVGNSNFTASISPSLSYSVDACLLEPVELSVDASGNEVFEVGETVLVSPGWKNNTPDALVVTGSASLFSGPAGATYTTVDATASYGSINPDAVVNCVSTGNCYSLGVSFTGARPSTHWDATFREDVSSTSESGARTWALHVGDSFADVPRTNAFYRNIEQIVHNGVTLGCTSTSYCPGTSVVRSAMAAFIARAKAGSDAAVPIIGLVGASSYDCSPGGVSLFSDVTVTSSFCRHIHYLAANQITLGCAAGLFCPAATVRRDAMAGFLARALTGSDAAVPSAYTDPTTGLGYDLGGGNVHFTDMNGNTFSRHAHYLWARGVTSGCGGTTYCPTQLVTRAPMAKFLANAFDLKLYEP